MDAFREVPNMAAKNLSTFPKRISRGTTLQNANGTLRYNEKLDEIKNHFSQNQISRQ